MFVKFVAVGLKSKRAYVLDFSGNIIILLILSVHRMLLLLKHVSLLTYYFKIDLYGGDTLG